jgi:hypothetical protein
MLFVIDDAEVQWFWCCWCRYYTDAEVVQKRLYRCIDAGAEVQTEHRDADREAEMQKCTDTEMKRCRGGKEEAGQRCTEVVQRCR